MTDSLTINEVVRQTGLTSRALRFYEARGLLAPLRTASGRRIFDAVQLERVHQIVTLKKAGLSLSQIGYMLNDRPLDLSKLLEGQLAHLSAQVSEIENAQHNLSKILSRIESGEPLDTATLCSLIRDSDRNMAEEEWKAVIDRFYTAEEQAHWQENIGTAQSEWQNEEYHQKWKDLSARIEKALPLAAQSDEALGFVREWFALLEPFSKVATPQMWEGAIKMNDSMPKWQDQVDPGFSMDVWNFIKEATVAAQEAGQDIGPLPAWMNR